MTFRTLLTPVADDARVEPHLHASVMLARAYGAALIGLGAEYYLPGVTASVLGPVDLSGALALAEREVIDRDLQAAEGRFRAAVAGLEPRGEWRSSTEMPVRALCRAATAADLIVLGDMPADDNDILRSISAADVVMQAGRPVLRTPASGMALEPAVVVVAWKNTREARRALADSLPFLRRAEAVIIMSVRESGDSGEAVDGIGDARAFLAAREIKATGVALPKSGRQGEDILLAAARASADLIVAGAFGHSRVGEWLFGGVTKTLLEQASVPVMFSR